MNVSEMLISDSPFLCKEMFWDIAVEVEIDRVEKVQVPIPGSSRKDNCFALYFRGKDKALVLRPRGRNVKFLVTQLGGKKTEEWRGKKIVLYADKTVRGPNGMGGIRVAVGAEHSGEQAPPQTRRTQPLNVNPQGDGWTPGAEEDLDGDDPSTKGKGGRVKGGNGKTQRGIAPPDDDERAAIEADEARQADADAEGA